MTARRIGGIEHANAQLVSLPALAAALRLPEDWLKGEADAGRLPHLRIGKRYRFSLSAVEAVLVARAASAGWTGPVADSPGPPTLEHAAPEQVYERLDRHVRTSASLRELAHWDEQRERSASRLTRPHDAALRREIKARFLELNGGGA